MVDDGAPEHNYGKSREEEADKPVEVARKTLNVRLNELYRSKQFVESFEWVKNSQVVKVGDSNQGEDTSFNWFIVHDLVREPRRSRILAVERDMVTDLSAGEVITVNQVFQFVVTKSEIIYNPLRFLTKRSLEDRKLNISSIESNLQSGNEIELIEQLDGLVNGFLGASYYNPLEFGDEELLNICEYGYEESLAQEF